MSVGLGEFRLPSRPETVWLYWRVSYGSDNRKYPEGFTFCRILQKNLMPCQRSTSTIIQQKEAAIPPTAKAVGLLAEILMKVYAAQRKSDGKFLDWLSDENPWKDRPHIRMLCSSRPQCEKTIRLTPEHPGCEVVELELSWPGEDVVRENLSSLDDSPVGGLFWIPWDPDIGATGLKAGQPWPKCCHEERPGTIMVMITKEQYGVLSTALDESEDEFQEMISEIYETAPKFKIVKYVAVPEWEKL